MNLWQRIKNLKRLSELEVPNIEEKISDYPVGTILVKDLIKKPEKAKIISYKPRDPVKEIVGEQETI